jgi:hypothetical protein
MLTLFRKSALSVFVIAILFGAAAALAQTDHSTSQVPITVTVTALGPKFTAAPAIPRDEVTAFSGSVRLNVTSWVRAQGSDAKLQLAILIDNDLGTFIIGRQMQDLASFINSQPPTTSIGVFYAENGAAIALSPFSTDHAAAATSLRMTAGRQGGSPSIYLSLADLVSHWSASNATRREALVIGSGFDPLNPGVEDPYADTAIDAAEKSGIDVHVILVPNPRYENSFRDNISEGKLIQASSGTGGQVLFQGAFVPVSFTPFLKQLDATLNNQYQLTFTIDRSNKKEGELRPLRVQTEQHGVKLYAPQQILVPGP